MGPNTRIYDKFTNYSTEDCDCAYCLYWQGVKRGSATLNKKSPDDIGTFADVIESGRHNSSIAEIINITFRENLDQFDLQPAFSEEQYGEFVLESDANLQDSAMQKLWDSNDGELTSLAFYIEELEKHIDREAYGRTAAERENGIFTEKGYLTGDEILSIIYHGSQNIPDDYRIFTKPGGITDRLPMKLEGVDISAVVMKLHAVCNGSIDFAAENLRTLIQGHDRDYLLLVNSSDVRPAPAIEAYKRGAALSEYILFSLKTVKDRPDTLTFAIRIDERGENGIKCFL